MAARVRDWVREASDILRLMEGATLDAGAACALQERGDPVHLTPIARDMPPLASHPECARPSAVQAGRVYVTDGNQHFNRPGPRVVESAEILAEPLHPDAVDFGHRGTGWVPWTAGSGRRP